MILDLETIGYFLYMEEQERKELEARSACQEQENIETNSKEERGQ